MRYLRTYSRCLMAAVLLVCMSCNQTGAENWPRFRGPNGQGISGESDFPVKWAEENYAWKTVLSGSGHSSPVVWGDKVFVTVVDKEIPQGTLLAFSTMDGRILWRKSFTLTTFKMHRDNSYAASTPALDANNVYTLWYGGDRTLVAALDHDGQIKWQRDFGETYQRFGPGASPMVYGDLVIFTQEQRDNDRGLSGSWHALDRNSGQTHWSIRRGTSGHASYSTRPYTGQPMEKSKSLSAALPTG